MACFADTLGHMLSRLILSFVYAIFHLSAALFSDEILTANQPPLKGIVRMTTPLQLPSNEPASWMTLLFRVSLQSLGLSLSPQDLPIAKRFHRALYAALQLLCLCLVY